MGRGGDAHREATAGDAAKIDEHQLLRLALHEMRNLLTSVHLNAQLLERSLAKSGLEKERRLSAMIASSERKLDSLIQDLADIARFRAGQRALTARSHDLSLLPETLYRLLGQADVSRIQVAMPPGPALVLADARHLERILTNLLSVGLRYEADQAGIELRVSPSEGEVLFAVTVTACPDAPGTPLPAPSDEELGLGFLVARVLVEAHGGKLQARQGQAGELVLSFSLPSATCA